MKNAPNEQTFKEWLDAHRDIVLRTARAFAATPDDQHDLVQEILVQLWHSTAFFNGQAKASTWTYRVALNKALNWQRAEKKHRARQVPILEAAQIRAPEEGFTLADLEGLYAAIRRLEKIDRSLLLLYLDGVSYRDMAEALGLSESNVGVRLNRAKKRLSEQMKEGTDEF
jgi:RNA polymerase sigma-70 factor (ECF subfamily)